MWFNKGTQTPKNKPKNLAWLKYDQVFSSERSSCGSNPLKRDPTDRWCTVSTWLTCWNCKRWLGACVERVRPPRCQLDLGPWLWCQRLLLGLTQIRNTILWEKNKKRKQHQESHNETGTKFDIQEVGGVFVMLGKNSNLQSVIRFISCFCFSWCCRSWQFMI